MTVLYITNNPQRAGTARILVSWVTLARDQGISSAVVLPAEGALATWLDEVHVPRQVSTLPWPNGRWPFPSLAEAWRIARFARRRGVTLIHCNEHDIYPFGSMVKRFLRTPIVCHVRFRVERGFCEWAFGGKRQPDALLWTSNQQRRDSAEAIAGIVPESRQHLIPLGPDPSVFAAGENNRAELRRHFDIAPDEIAIGVASALRPIKRIGDFVAVIQRLAAQSPKIVGLIAGGAVPGDEQYCADIQAAVASSGLGRRLRWLGHLEPVAPFLQSLDVFLSTSEYETFGNSVVEAMACRLPVAAYVGGSVQEVIGEAGLVVANGDVNALADATAQLALDEGARRYFATLGFERAQREFRPAASFAKLLDVYRSVDAGRSEYRG